MKKTLLSLALLASLTSVTNAQYFTENFDGNGPGISNWTLIDVDGNTPYSTMSFVNNAWVTIDRLNYNESASNMAAASTSWYTPAGTSNDWLISPVINLTNSVAPRLKFQAKAQDPDYRDGYLLKVAPNGGNTVADFTDTLFSTNGENGDWTQRVFGLEAYNGQSIRIAWVNNSNDMFLLFVDDIVVEETPALQEYTLPFTETFESNSSSRDFWTNVNVAGTANWTYGTGSSGGTLVTAHGGTLNAKFVSTVGSNTPITKLVSPKIDAGNNTAAYLQFYHANPDWLGDVNALKVYYRADETSEWVELFSQTDPVETWTKQTIQLPGVSSTMQIAFEGINNFGRANVIDDVQVLPGQAPMVVSMPFYESFEDNSNSRIGWTQQAVVSSTTPATDLWTYVAGSNTVSGSITSSYGLGSKNARFVSKNGTNSPITKLITPVVDAGSNTSGYLEFYHGNPAWGTDINTLKVYYRLSTTSEWVELYSNTTNKEVWTKEQIQLPQLSREMQFAFEGANNWGRPNVIDDVKVQIGTIPTDVSCGDVTISNQLENGVGNIAAAKYAVDFKVDYGTKFTLSDLVFTTVAQSDLTSAKVSIHTDNNGSPGDVVFTYTGAPTSSELSGQNFGFQFVKQTYTLDTPLDIINETEDAQRYWFVIEGGVLAGATQTAYLESIRTKANDYNVKTFGSTSTAWGEAQVELVYEIVGECTNIIEPTETCINETSSNGVENGHGTIMAGEIAHDFQLEPNTTMEFTKLAVNLLSTSGVTSAVINVYKDNNGEPGELLTSFTGDPTKEYVGSNFGFESSTYTYTLPTPLSLEGGRNGATYWIGVTQATIASGTAAYWESTTALNSTYKGKFKNSTGIWTEFSSGSWDGVFIVAADCAGLAIDDQLVEVKNLTFYPNPVKDILYVKHESVITNIEVLNITGQNVMSTKLNAKDGSINVSNLPAGVYIITAEVDGTKKSFKIIKK